MQSRRNGRSPGRKTDRLASMYLRATNPAYRPRKTKRAERTPPKNRKKRKEKEKKTLLDLWQGALNKPCDSFIYACFYFKTPYSLEE